MNVMYRSKKYLCFLLTVIMLISWVCFENIKADSFLGYEQIRIESMPGKLAESGANTCEQVLKSELCQLFQGNDICTNELISPRVEISSLYHQRRNAERQILKSITVLCVLIDIISKILHTSQCIARQRSISIKSEHFIIKYIHHQDGSKG